jgi:D-alanyl-D-alanine carboxypeptidase
MKKNQVKSYLMKGIMIGALIASWVYYSGAGAGSIMSPVKNILARAHAAYNISTNSNIPAFSLNQIAAADDSTATDILILLNKDNKLPADFKADLTKYENIKVAIVLVDDLQEMRKAAEKENIYLYINTAYRTKAEQEQIFNKVVSNYVEQGNSRSVAWERANKVAALPGYSEHETGLALDFSLSGNGEKQAEMWRWLGNNAYKYGFILRYPENKEHITGYIYEPWHYRSVGKDHARAINELGYVLEEYLLLRKHGE